MGNTQYIVSFLTKDNQDDVLNFYKGEFQKRSWTVNDSAMGNTGFALSIDFKDPKNEVQGTIKTDAFQDDPTYTKVDVLVQVAANRGRGN